MNHNNSGLHCPKALGASIPPINSQHDRVHCCWPVKSRPEVEAAVTRNFPPFPVFAAFSIPYHPVHFVYMVGVGGGLKERHARISPTRMSPLTHAPHQLATIYCVCCARYWLWCCNHSTGSGSNRWSGWPPQSQVFTKKDRRKRMKTETAL